MSFASHTRHFRAIWGNDRPPLEPTVAKADQDNTTVFFGDRFVLKLFRKVGRGAASRAGDRGDADAGGISACGAAGRSGGYRGPAGEPMVAAVLHGYVRGSVESWQYMLDHLGRYYERALATPADQHAEVPEHMEDLPHEFVRLLGTRTAELHLALAGSPGRPVYSPGAVHRFSPARAVSRLHRPFGAGRGGVAGTVEPAAAIRSRRMHRRCWTGRLPAREAALYARHADYSGAHTDPRGFASGQVLYTGKDFVFIDFEGDPARPLSERRLKRSPLRDVAGMLDSFYHASHRVTVRRRARRLSATGSMNAIESLAKSGTVGPAESIWDRTWRPRNRRACCRRRGNRCGRCWMFS